MSSSLLLLVAALFLVFLNGFFVAAEFGLVKLRATRVKALAKTLGWRGRVLARVHGDLDAYLSACQLGITLASLGLGWIGEPAFARLIEPIFALFGITNPKLIHATSISVAFFTISYLHIVVGELAPKSMALRMAERVAIWTALPLYLFYWLAYPAIWALNHSANRVLKLLRLDPGHHHDSHYSADELKLILRNSDPSDEYSRDEWRTLAQALDFRKLKVTDLMRPFSEAIALYQDDRLADNLNRMVQHRYSRYPLVATSGEVLGIIHLKDLFLDQQKGHELTELTPLMRPVLRVRPDESAPELLRRFQEGSPHFAVVAFDDEEPLGFITLDNLLGAVIGEIRDEFRQARNDWTRLEDGTLIGKGSLPIFSLERALGIDIPSEEVDSIGGLIQWQLGELPKEGERISFAGFDVVVKKMNGPRIVLVRVHPKLERHDEP